MQKFRNLLYLLFFILLAACNTTKNIAEDEYLLNDITVKHNSRNATSDLESFVRQQPNSNFLFFGKVRLGIFNMAGQDTSKWVNRLIQRIGEPPVIYSPKLTALSVSQLRKELMNEGYLNAKADSTLRLKGKKMNVTYNIDAHVPYTIRNYTYAIEDTAMAHIMKLVPLKAVLNKGDFFDMELLEQERNRVNKVMRNVGYQTFSKEYVYFKADTTLNSHQVDLYMNIYPAKDSLPYPRFKLNKITVVSGINSTEAPTGQTGKRKRNASEGYFRNADSTEYNGITIIRGKRNFLRNTTIYQNNYMRMGERYADYKLTATYEAFNKMPTVKQVNIITKPAIQDSLHLLDATILLSPANAHWIKTSVDGTNSAGDIGFAPSITYQHQNLFNGAEQLSIKLKGAYEYISAADTTNLLNQSYYEFGVESGLTFPRFLFPFLKKSWREKPTATTRVSLGFTNQHRPEYTRQFFNTTLGYAWASKQNALVHGFDLLDVNYVRISSMSPIFRDSVLNNDKNQLLKESYKNQLIARTSYSVSFTNKNIFSTSSSHYVIRASSEVAGLLPLLVSSISNSKNDSVLGVPYAEYIKGTLDFAYTQQFSKKHSLAYHVLLGLAQPYGRSTVLPFERRFFEGGANGIRGWNTRSLGPGSYKTSNRSDFVNQVGDMRLNLSIENRHKMTQSLDLAEFIDAGNVWTLRNYENGQLGGQFRLATFYKEIAVAYGLGIRMDLDFLVLRFDVGMRAYDPGLDQSDRFVLLSPRLARTAWHFGIGYPF